MPGFEIDPHELDVCRQLLLKEAARFEEIRAGTAGAGLGGTPFGTLPAGANLARLCQELAREAAAQFGAAESFLDTVGQGLHGMRERTTQTERTTARALQTVRGQELTVVGPPLQQKVPREIPEPPPPDQGTPDRGRVEMDRVIQQKVSREIPIVQHKVAWPDEGTP